MLGAEATDAKAEQVEQLRRTIHDLVVRAVLHSHEVTVENGRLVLGGGRAEEFTAELEPYQPSGLPAHYYAKLRNANVSDSGAALARVVDQLRRGEGDVVFKSVTEFSAFECGPQKITVVGAPPGAGKTAFVMQYIFGVRESHADVPVVIANAEMTIDALLKRELSRRTGIPMRAIRFADLVESQLAKVEEAAIELEALLSAVDIMPPPYTLERLGDLLSRPPGLLVVDYLQKFAPSDDPRVGTNDVMGMLRTLCHAGWAVLALSSTSRGKKGHSSDDLSLASFKESGEIEFNADLCYLLRDNGAVDDGELHVRNVLLECVKNRHGAKSSLELVFDMPRMEFYTPEPPKHDEFTEYEGSPFVTQGAGQ